MALLEEFCKYYSNSTISEQKPDRSRYYYRKPYFGDEDAADGTPSVAFNIEGVTDEISNSNGDLVEPGRYDHFSQVALGYLKQTQFNPKQRINQAKKYSWEQFNKKLTKIILAPGGLEAPLSAPL